VSPLYGNRLVRAISSVSLKLRLAIAGALVIALSVAGTVTHAIREMQERTEASIIDSNLGAAQLAATLSANVIDRQRALSAAAHEWPRAQPADEGRTELFLGRQGVLRSLFNEIMVVPDDAVAAGERTVPFVPPEGEGLAATGHVAVLLAIPLPTASRPALLAGSLRLQSRNFLSSIAGAARLDDANIGTIVADRQGRVLAHADPQRLMTRVDDDPLLQSAVARWRGQGSPLEPAPWTARFGEHFVAMAAVPGTDWMVFRVADTETLFGDAVRSMMRIVLLGVSIGLAGALAIFGIAAWFLRPMSRLRQRAGRTLDVDQSPSEGWPEAGGEVGELSRVLRDVSVRLTASRLDMEQSLQRMQAVLTHAPVGIGFTNESRFDLVSEELECMLGHETGGLRDASWQAILSPEAPGEALRDAAEAAFRQGRNFEAEVPLHRRDGSTLWARVHGAAVQGMRQRRIWIVSDATDARRQREVLMWNATRDPLTDLINRREFERQLAQMVGDRRRDPACALFIDLDHFKAVNDGAGHAAGDAILKRIAQALQKRVRAGDSVGRLGGDEFAVLLRRCDLPQGLRIAEQIRACVQVHGICDVDPALRVTASVGVVAIDAGHRSLAEVLEAADSACYAAKHAGRNAVRSAGPQRSLAACAPG